MNVNKSLPLEFKFLILVSLELESKSIVLSKNGSLAQWDGKCKSNCPNVF
jgi:hypothetical protein